MTAIQKQLTDILRNISKKPHTSPDESLFSSGLLDSLSMLTFLNLIEETFKITILNDRFDVRNFDNLKMIENFLNQSNHAGTE